MKRFSPKIRFRVGRGRLLIVFSLLLTALTIGPMLHASAQVTGDVSPGPLQINNPPVAVDDNVSTPMNTPFDIMVLANDSDPDGDPLAVWVSDDNGTAGGTIQGHPLMLTYTPPKNFVGTDTFTYKGYDGHTASNNKATVTVTVTNDVVSDPHLQINLPPVAVDDSVTTPMNTSVDIAVVANDSDPNGDPLKLGTWDGNSAAGGLVFDSNGTHMVYQPPKDFVGTDTITYAAYDGSLFSNKATVTVTVTDPSLRSSEK
jgi:hypothetical protein